MRQDREPRQSTARESDDTPKTSVSTDSAVAAHESNAIATTTVGDQNSEGSPSRPTESSGVDGGKAQVVPPGKQGATKKEDGAAESKGRVAGPAKNVKVSDLIRNRVASVVWLVAVLAAVVLSLGALVIALGANQQNTVVESVLDAANRIDGPFWRIFDFYEENSQGARIGPDTATNHLVNWGLAAVAYLIGGRILDRVIRP